MLTPSWLWIVCPHLQTISYHAQLWIGNDNIFATGTPKAMRLREICAIQGKWRIKSRAWGKQSQSTSQSSVKCRAQRSIFCLYESNQHFQFKFQAKTKWTILSSNSGNPIVTACMLPSLQDLNNKHHAPKSKLFADSWFLKDFFVLNFDDENSGNNNHLSFAEKSRSYS